MGGIGFISMTLIIYCSLLYDTGWCDRVHDKIYYDVFSITQCFRRLNATHQVGCASDQGGNVGVLHYVPAEAELNWLINNGPHKPYIVLLTQHVFNGEVIHALRKSGKVNGVLVIMNTTDLPAHFSPDSSCPNTNFELYKGDSKYEHCKSAMWNPMGNDLLMTDIEFPIVALLNETQISFLIDECYEKFNKPVNGTTPRSYPLCGAEIKAGMDAVKNTPTCINRGKTRNLNPRTVVLSDYSLSVILDDITDSVSGFPQFSEQICDPLGDANVFGFLHPIRFQNKTDFNDTLEEGSIIMAATKLDATGLFQYIVPGAYTTVAGFVTLLAAAQALGSVKESIDPVRDKPIMFAFFQGESFDYMGSIRMLYDMEHGPFPTEVIKDSDGPHPIKPGHIGYFLEVGQVASLSGLYSHSDPRSNQNDTVKSGVNKMEDLLEKFGKDLNISIKSASDDLPLPPSSLQTFLKKINISGVVLTDHERKFENQFYNSYLDLYSNINYTATTKDNQTEVTALAQHLTEVATVVARTLYNMSTGHQYNGSDNGLMADSSLVAEMLYCFFLSPRCELLNFTSDEHLAKRLPEVPFDYYVGVERDPSLVTLHIERILSYFIGNAVNLTAENCTTYETHHQRNPYYNYMWMRGPVNASSATEERVGLCMETTVNKSLATSPAFIKGNDLSGTEYPSWSESVWSAGIPNVRVFLIPDKTYEIVTLCVGIAVLVVSLPTLFLFNRRATILFLAE
ncbi:hypothetical protein LSH36_202g04004 [Paralvinella palmiformis]|uniref:Nicastrin n=1 Tax=Paralvinella palmiformis TaxID=53620 RepID=A0AAD9JQT6_9ANNE|nr:hypothetical protein LSH36_202g04004 [Paralvinella palmiformis]